MNLLIPATKKIPLTRGKYALVDDENFELVSRYKWCFDESNGYAHRTLYLGGGKRNQKQKKIYLHRYIMDFPKNFKVDHINSDKLDCRRSNLRLATASENSRHRKLDSTNTSGFVGVYFNKSCKKWQAYINFKNKSRYIGAFKNKISAAQARDRVAVRLHGKFATLNLCNY